METEVTPWWENNVGVALCQAMACMQRSRFYRFIVIDGHEFRQFACERHADKENEFCEQCGHYLDSKTVCPRCGHSTEEHVNAD